MGSGCTKFVYVSQRQRSSDRGRSASANARPFVGSGRGNPGMDGFRALQENQRVEYTAGRGPKGPQAEEVHPI